MTSKKETYFWLLVLLYILNDFLFMSSDDYIVWLLIDYSVRIITLLALFMLYKDYILTKKSFFLGSYSYKRALVIGTGLALFGVIVFRLIEVNLTMINIYDGTSFPEIKNRILYWIDMSAGLVLVSFSEELVFHAYFYTVYKDKLSNFSLILFSAIIFSAIHWSNDLSNILGVFIWGIVSMQVFIRSQSAWPLIVGHILVNLILFLEILPDRWFVI